MRLRHIAPLIAKDFRLHGRGIALAHGGGLLLFAAAWQLAPQQTDALPSLIFNINFIAALIWAEWLISREKAKGTFAWLRTLPVADRDLVVAKFTTEALCGVAFWTLSSMLFTRSYFFPDRVGVWVVLQLILLVFGAMSIASRWRFQQKLGQVLPLIVVFIPVTLFMLARRLGLDVTDEVWRVWSSDGGQALIAVALVACYALVLAITARWVARSDTFQLIE